MFYDVVIDWLNIYFFFLQLGMYISGFLFLLVQLICSWSSMEKKGVIPNPVQTLCNPCDF